MRRVVSPRVSTYSVTCHQWLRGGTVAIRILPTIWQYRCKVSFVARQSASRSSGSIERLHQAGRFVGAAVHGPVDEQGRRSAHLARGDAALDVAANAVQHPGAGPVALERSDVESELIRVAHQVVVVERLLAVEKQLVHLPEAVLPRRGLGGGGRRECVRVDLGQREMAEREADATGQPALDEPDLPERPPRVRTLVVAVLDDQAPGRYAAHVIDRAVQC